MMPVPMPLVMPVSVLVVTPMPRVSSVHGPVLDRRVRRPMDSAMDDRRMSNSRR
jgi:hypothetical protein